ncbi:MAG: ATP-binding protein [Burkholderiales bacterium]|nr:ATP-binding protein [Burkholderiales bacterium]
MELVIRADVWDARRASQWLEVTAVAHGVPVEQRVRLDHCLDEALANVIKHGGATASAAAVVLAFGVRRGKGVCAAELLVVDAGEAFDPSVLPDAPMRKPRNLAEADVGGLGLVMIRNFSDDLRYRRSGGRNHLTITVSWTEAT